MQRMASVVVIVAAMAAACSGDAERDRVLGPVASDVVLASAGEAAPRPVRAASDPAAREPSFDAKEWVRVDCSTTRMGLPFSQPYECELETKRAYDKTYGECRGIHYQAYGDDGTVAFLIDIAFSGSAYGGCGWLVAAGNEERFVRHATSFAARYGTGFSPMKPILGLGAMTFTARTATSPINCFSFGRLGHRLSVGSEGHRYIVQGHACKRDGGSFSDGDIEKIVAAVWEK